MKEYTTEETIEILKSKRRYDIYRLEATLKDALNIFNEIEEVNKKLDELEKE